MEQLELERRHRQNEVFERLEKQDTILQNLYEMSVKHNAQHTLTDPALYELVAILRGAKLLKQVAMTIAAIVGGGWAFVEFVWKHITLR
jgi:hypothetical protein